MEGGKIPNKKMKIALCQLFLNKRCDRNKLPMVKSVVLKISNGSIKFSLPKIRLKIYETKTYKCVVDAEIFVAPLKPITP